tara:strand:+ start:372 stop:1082 length:711 start_codon:yes stop_codon:yes gene_type:complete
MAKIISYPSVEPVKGDLVLGTKQATVGTKTNPTKNFTVESVVEAGLTSDALLFKGVGLTFTTGEDYRALTNRTDGSFPSNCKYEKLKIDFSNLTLEPGYTYKLVIERWKKGGLRGGNIPANTYKRTGYRALGSKTNESMQPPFTERPGAITITSTTGQVFDFRPDLYYSSGTGVKGFPKLSGQSKTSAQATSKQFFQFRISRTDGSGNTVLSPALAQLKLIGSILDGRNRITWSAL